MWGAVLPLAACAPDPAISGGPEAVWSMEPTNPVQQPALSEATEIVAAMRDGVAAIKRAAPTWDPPGDVGQWADPSTRMLRSYLDRLRSTSVFSEPDPHFELPPASEPMVGATEAHAEAWLADTIAGATADLRSLAQGTDDQPLRLVFISVAAGLAGTADRTIQPVPGPAVPVRFAETGPNSAVEVALTHTWALIRGLEVGLGRLGSEDPLTALGTRRMDSARVLRNELRDSTDESPEQGVDYELPTTMADPQEIRQGWGVLEENLLGALCRLFIATTASEWFDAAIEQVAHVQAAGRPLPYWPGWVSR